MFHYFNIMTFGLQAKRMEKSVLRQAYHREKKD